MKKVKKVLSAFLPSIVFFGMAVAVIPTFFNNEAGKDTAIYSQDNGHAKFGQPDYVYGDGEDDGERD